MLTALDVQIQTERENAASVTVLPEEPAASILFSPAEMKDLLCGLLTPNPYIYWTDLLVTCAIGWSGLALACALPLFSPPMLLAFAVSVACLYRAAAFNHELAHQPERTLPGYRFAWEVLVGIPMLVPSILYVGMHGDHHRTQSYGTDHDPEYQPFSGRKAAISFFVAHSVLFFPILFLRFLVLAPVGLLVPALHRFLERHASALTFNPRYRRAMNDRERRELRYSECAVLAFWCGGIELLRIAQAPLGRLAMIYATVIASIALINSLRTLGAHKYQSDGEVLSKASQIADSIDTPDSWFAFVWAPAGLRFHALHHLFPTVPYHNLSKLYERILQRRHQPYLQSVVSPALRSSLKNLWSDTHV